MTPKPIQQRKRRGLNPAELKKLELLQVKSIGNLTAVSMLRQALKDKNIAMAKALLKHPDSWVSCQAKALLLCLGEIPLESISYKQAHEMLYDFVGPHKDRTIKLEAALKLLDHPNSYVRGEAATTIDRYRKNPLQKIVAAKKIKKSKVSLGKRLFSALRLE